MLLLGLFTFPTVSGLGRCFPRSLILLLPLPLPLPLLLLLFAPVITPCISKLASASIPPPPPPPARVQHLPRLPLQHLYFVPLFASDHSPYLLLASPSNFLIALLFRSPDFPFTFGFAVPQFRREKMLWVSGMERNGTEDWLEVC
ncbi:hypothetical protein M758_5G197200 [Ceratodon purpureus]|nr:hypothetical protein M758_5G197200 [Ceratodon purpureus]